MVRSFGRRLTKKTASALSGFFKRERRPFLPVAVHVAAFWPIWKWLYWRLTVCPNETFELLPLAIVPLLVFFRLRQQVRRAAAAEDSDAKKGSMELKTAFSLWSGALFFTLLYSTAYPFVPDLFRGALAFSALAFSLSALSGKKMDFGLWGLLLLVLQLHNGFQFYLGYPLRALVAAVAAPFLRLTGFSVFREGTCLNWEGKLILIDAPCSGVKMLWAGLFLVFVLMSAYRMSFRRSAALLLGAVFLILTANIFRATSLFYLESGVLTAPEFFHALTGMVSFIFACLGILWIAERIKRRESCVALGSS